MILKYSLWFGKIFKKPAIIKKNLKKKILNFANGLENNKKGHHL